jgi:hypothetical protein
VEDEPVSVHTSSAREDLVDEYAIRQTWEEQRLCMENCLRMDDPEVSTQL